MDGRRLTQLYVFARHNLGFGKRGFHFEAETGLQNAIKPRAFFGDHRVRQWSARPDAA